ARRAAEALASSSAAREAGLTRVEVAGEVRRSLEVVTEIVLVASCERPEALPESMEKDGGPTISVHAVRPEGFGTAFLLATGADAHLAELRALAGDGELARPAAREEEVYAR